MVVYQRVFERKFLEVTANGEAQLPDLLSNTAAARPRGSPVPTPEFMARQVATGRQSQSEDGCWFKCFDVS